MYPPGFSPNSFCRSPVAITSRTNDSIFQVPTIELSLAYAGIDRRNKVKIETKFSVAPPLARTQLRDYAGCIYDCMRDHQTAVPRHSTKINFLRCQNSRIL